MTANEPGAVIGSAGRLLHKGLASKFSLPQPHGQLDTQNRPEQAGWAWKASAPGSQLVTSDPEESQTQRQEWAPPSLTGSHPVNDRGCKGAASKTKESQAHSTPSCWTPP